MKKNKTQYRIGEKFIIEIDSHMVNEKNVDIYGIKGFRSLVFDANGLGMLERMEEAKSDMASEETWKLAGKIYDMDWDEIIGIFPGITHLRDIFQKYSAQEATVKTKMWEGINEIKAGDVVECDGIPGIVTQAEDKQNVYVLCEDGSGGKWAVVDIEKTGRHIDIDQLLSQIGGEK